MSFQISVFWYVSENKKLIEFYFDIDFSLDFLVIYAYGRRAHRNNHGSNDYTTRGLTYYYKITESLKLLLNCSKIHEFQRY